MLHVARRALHVACGALYVARCMRQATDLAVRIEVRVEPLAASPLHVDHRRHGRILARQEDVEQKAAERVPKTKRRQTTRTASCGVARGASHAVCRMTCVACYIYGTLHGLCCVLHVAPLRAARCVSHVVSRMRRLRVASCTVRCARRVGRARDDCLDDIHPLLVRPVRRRDPSFRHRCGEGEPSPGADVAALAERVRSKGLQCSAAPRQGTRGASPVRVNTCRRWVDYDDKGAPMNAAKGAENQC